MKQLDGFLEEAASFLECLLPGLLNDAAVKHLKASKQVLAGLGMMLLLGILESSYHTAAVGTHSCC